ncbi:MAG: helix-turn-helix domain-containing protein [Nocardiopsaceae bacterium]|nr:helix-turn-helix domain-containing protein [Nocardiopsaceae bacterium]
MIRQAGKSAAPPAAVPGPRGPTVARLVLGSRLHRLRTRAGIGADQAGEAIRASRSKISRIENGRVGIKARDVSDLLDLYGVTDEAERAGMTTLARQSAMPGWWSKYDDVMSDWLQDYLGLEAAASGIRAFEPQVVHGLFQTEDYARRVTMLAYPAAPADQIDRRVHLRLRRQKLLDAPDGPHVWMILDEGALRRPVGGVTVLRGQLERLLELTGQRGITIQAVPYGHGAGTVPSGPFTLLRFSEPDVPDIVYVEHLTGAVCLDKQADVDRYGETMDDLAVGALSPGETRDFLVAVRRDT